MQADGKVWLNKEIMGTSELLDRLISKRMDNAEMGVILRGDGTAKYRQVRAVLDVCQQANVTKVDLATEASDKKK